MRTQTPEARQPKSNDAIGGEIRFPVNLTVERKELPIPVDGEDQPFTAYLSRRLAVAVGKVGGRWVYVATGKRELRRVSLKQEKAVNLKRFLDWLDKNLTTHHAEVDAFRARVEAGQPLDG
jgi:hypothetical protein